MAKICTERDGAVLTVTFDNQARRNAFTSEMTAELGRVLDAAEVDPSVHCVILTGAGETAFTSGHDLAEMLEAPEHASDPDLNLPFLRPASMRTTTIAAIEGFAFAAGFILALNCDFRVVSSGASFCAPGARIGLLPIGGQLSRLPAFLPRSIAHELLVTCRTMDGLEAQRLGFANRLTTTGGALAAAQEMATEITDKSGSVVAAVKEGLGVFDTEGADAARAFEWTEGRRLQDAPDAREGISAFLEKRTARFS